jgi:hypothetical protein
MDITTGAILRRITRTPLSVSAHKLATVILDAIAWKDGYNGLERGTAAFTLAELAERMDVSRQHLSVLLAELEASSLRLVRWKPNGKFAPWLFRFEAPTGEPAAPGHVSDRDDTSLSEDSRNKTIFAGKIEIGAQTNVHRTPWAELIRSAKTALPCWNVDPQAIWERFLAFNRGRGNAVVPAGYHQGFKRKWRISSQPDLRQEAVSPTLNEPCPKERQLLEEISAAPVSNRQFHASDLCRLIGEQAYKARVANTARQYGCPRFTATLAVHGRAVLAGEIER